MKLCKFNRKPIYTMMFVFSRTTKRPVPLEHCIFYSGELYKICENETFMPCGLKAAKDVSRRKNMPSMPSNSSRSVGGGPSSSDNNRSQKHESHGQPKQNKHFGSRSSGGNQNIGNNNSWGLRRSEASMWLTLITKLSKMSLLPVSLSLSS